jgi:ubiquinone/menaquinone biosynthesis C-methylase UbiE
MNPNRALWEKRDFTRIATTMRESGEAVVDSLGITAGSKVLDLGRAKAEGLTNCRFQQGDATNLSEPADRNFDLVVTISRSAPRTPRHRPRALSAL